MDYKFVTQCRICSSSLLSLYLDLGDLPLPNKLSSSEKEVSKIYPLQVVYCQECSLSQLNIVVDPKILYSNYPYHSSVSKTFQVHCKSMAKEFRKYFKDWEKPLVIDIASNDGCLLEQFKYENYYVMGIEPCKELALKSEKKNISTINCFFSKEEVTNKFGANRIPGCDIITATNVFAHVDNLREFLELCHGMLRRSTKSFIAIEVPYLANLIFDNQFDTIYHEHLSYFLLKPLIRLFESCDMSIFKVEEHDIHGGSIRVYAARKSYPKVETYNKEGKVSIIPAQNECVYPEEVSVRDMEQFEEVNGLYDLKTYLEYSMRVKDVKDHLKSLLEDLKLQGKRVVGYGASAKGIMMMNGCWIDSSYVEAVVDDTKAKQGKFIPGCGIPIVSSEYFEKNKPDYILLLSWNFAEELKEKTRHLGAKYITAIPRVELS